MAGTRTVALAVPVPRGRRRAGLCGLAIVVAVTALAAGAPWLAPHDPYAQDVAGRLAPPVWLAGGTWLHPLGSDPRRAGARDAGRARSPDRFRVDRTAI